MVEWDGTEWTQLFDTLHHPYSQIHGVTSFDPDGEGPSNPLLLFYGRFTSINSQQIAGIAAWDGQSLSALGGGSLLDAYVHGLGTWDFDGDGPDPTRLVAAGSFSLQGQSNEHKLLMLDGDTWNPLPTPWISQTTYAAFIGGLDIDGPGPQPPRLVASPSGFSPQNVLYGWSDGAGTR